jgi:site-specific recombinase XerD
MRRTFCCHLARSGASNLQMQRSMGHKNFTTTARYVEAVGAEIAHDVLMNQPAPVER